jgi:hypothetical protein
MNTFFLHVRRVLAMALLLVATACATRPAAPDAPLPFDQAAAQATDRLVAQVSALPAFLANARGIVHDPTLDAESGQQTNATKRLDNAVAASIAARNDRFELLPFRSANLANAHYLLTSTTARVADTRVLRIELALVELKTGTVVAQSSALARDEHLDHAPLPYYRDSPVLVKDQVIEGYVRTTSTPRGQRGDAFYLERIAIATRVDEATDLYNQARYREALGEYRSALATPAGEQLRVLNGIYLATAKLGRTAEAEQAFGRVVAMGIAYRQLSVKFLFNPGTTQFWVDPRINSPYPMWLRQIARETTAAKVCMDIAGHTSRTGKAAANEALSLRRAVDIKQRLVGEAPALASRTNTVGMGFRQNLIGSGTDDAIDVLDRRVEFRIVPCK